MSSLHWRGTSGSSPRSTASVKECRAVPRDAAAVAPDAFLASSHSLSIVRLSLTSVADARAERSGRVATPLATSLFDHCMRPKVSATDLQKLGARGHETVIPLESIDEG